VGRLRTHKLFYLSRELDLLSRALDLIISRFAHSVTVKKGSVRFRIWSGMRYWFYVVFHYTFITVQLI